MAAPSYNTDLILIDAADATGAWIEATGTGTDGDYGSGGTPTADTEYFIQRTSGTGNGAVTQSAGTKTGLKSIMYGGSGYTVPEDGAFFIWEFWGAPNSISSQATGGMRVVVGNSGTAYRVFYVGGSDKNPGVYGGWINHVCDPNLGGYEDTVGSPTGTWSHIGVVANCNNAVTKGNPHGADALRYGRGMARFSAGSLADGYATFDGFAALNDASTARWGLCQFLNGSYLVKGRFIFGMNSGGSDAAVEFVDSNRILFIQDVQKVSANFNRFEVRHASSIVNMTSISITSLSTVSRGRWETVAGTVTKTSCVFTAMGTFIYGPADTLTSCTWAQCNKITTGGATLTNCLIRNSNDAAIALTTSSPANAAKISKSTFISPGTGHGIEVTGTAADFTLTDVLFTGYSGTSTNAAVYVNTGAGSVKITIAGGTDITGNVRAAAGVTVTVEVGARAVKVVVVDTDGAAVASANVFMRAGPGGPFPYLGTVTTITRAATVATVAHAAHGLATDDKVLIAGITDKIEDNRVVTITKINDDSYSFTTTDSGSTNYTGATKTATFVFLKGLATAGAGSNEITMSRPIPSTQPVIGWARKSTGGSLYKTGTIAGNVVSTGDSTFSAVLVSDD